MTLLKQWMRAWLDRADGSPRQRSSDYTPSWQSCGREPIEVFLSQFPDGSMDSIANGPNTEQIIVKRMAQLDHVISAQLNEVMHHADFQRLEASCRGLRYLTEQSAPGNLVRIKVLNVTKRELLEDFQCAPDFDQSALFEKVYGDVYSTFGCAPFGALVGDYEFGKDAEEVELLEKISHVAAAAHAPFATAADPDLFNLPSYTCLDAPRDLAKIFDTTEYAKWKSFRQSEDSRYVALCLPRTLGRLPYGKDTKAVEAFNYEEHVDGTDHSKYLWMNAAYALAARMTNSFSKYGLCVALRGVEGGGLVEGLPVHIFYTDDGDVAMKCPTEIPISDHREKELDDLGFVPLVHCKGTDYAAFFSVPSVQNIKLCETDSANVHARQAIEIPRIMAVARFAHYMKAMMRDKTGPAMSRNDVEDLLNRWITDYVNPDILARADMPALYPLRQARIDVNEISGKSGCYRAVAELYPDYLLEEVRCGVRVVIDLPAPVR